jgi:tyrosyl-DNA phosphodiesterase 2
MGRRLLVAELALNGTITSVATVHLESLRASTDTRAEQLAQIFPLLALAPHALLMGDFNFCASWVSAQAHLDPGYSDLWAALHPDELGYTEDTAINTMRLQQKGRHKHVRFDRVLLRSRQPGWSPQAIQLLGTTAIHAEAPAIFPSDHFGLLAQLTWR